MRPMRLAWADYKHYRTRWPDRAALRFLIVRVYVPRK